VLLYFETSIVTMTTLSLDTALDASDTTYTPIEKQDETDSNSTNVSTTTVVDKLYCQCRIAVHCNQCGKPMKDRATTNEVIKALCSTPRPSIANVFGNGPLLLSDIPESCCTISSSPNHDIVLGIDEAGRGSVLGPMVYGAAYWSSNVEKNIPKDFNDSKQLKEADRERLFGAILKNPDIGFVVRSLLPSEISRNMLREHPYNLNEMSHDAAITMIRKLLDQSVPIKRAYIDTVGHPQAYQRKLEREFPGIDFVVESKADAKYAPCSAASVGKIDGRTKKKRNTYKRPSCRF
jgi:ribonuclease H